MGAYKRTVVQRSLNVLTGLMRNFRPDFYHTHDEIKNNAMETAALELLTLGTCVRIW